MIWNSVYLMTLLDVVIIAIASASVRMLYREWRALVESRLLAAACVVVLGLVGIGLFYLTDLFIMWGLPLFIPHDQAIAVMENLHLNYSGGLMLVVTASISLGICNLMRGMFVQTERLRGEVDRRERADRAHDESEERFRSLFQGLIHPSYVWQRQAGEFVLIDFNRAAAVIGEGMLERFKGKSLAKMASVVVPSIAVEIRRCFESQRPIQTEITDQSFESVSDRSLVLSYTYVSPDLVLVHMEDITVQKQAEEERLRLDAHLRQHQKLEAIGVLASGVAHEINNPINGIMNYAQLIDDRIGAESSLHEFAQGIGRETERVAKIVRNLLAFSRNHIEEHASARIVDIVDDTLSLVRTFILKDQIALDVEVPEDLPRIKCCSQEIQQVIMNLLTNARDSLNQRYPGQDPDKIMKLVARPFERAGRDGIRLTVEDHGAGISEEIRDRVFDPFFTTKERSKGTGLGLSISRSIIQDHHGELYVECSEGEYTRFQIELPVADGLS